MTKKVLFISGSVGLGHVLRDLAIARELKKIDYTIEISWLAGEPAAQVIREVGEVLLEESKDLGQDSYYAEKMAKGHGMNVNNYLFSVLREWMKSVWTIKKLTKEKEFDLIIGDEVYELIVAFLLFPKMKKSPFVMIYDFLGIEPMTKNIFERMGTYFWNLAWVLGNKARWVEDLSLFVGNEEDIPDRSFGAFLPNYRTHAMNHYKFLGNIISYNPTDYADSKGIKEKLGYGDTPMIVCTVGGTSIGVELLNLCARTYALIKEEIPDIQMVIVCGPRINTDDIETASGIEVKGYVPNLYEYFAACDLAIVQGGGTTTMELVSLNKKFIYFPLSEHYEQEVVSDKLTRMDAGIKLNFKDINEVKLSRIIEKTLVEKVDYKDVNTNGAMIAANHIAELLVNK